MKIYVAHSRSFDFKKDLYDPIKNSSLNEKHTFIFPHDEAGESLSAKELFKNDCDLVIAEVSYPATGLGIELGRADMLGVPIVCVYRKGSKISESLKRVTETFLEYSDTDDLISKIVEAIMRSENK